MSEHDINAEVADAFDEVARLLEVQDKNPYRIGSYRRAADELRGLDRSVADIVEESGAEGLQEIEGIGDSLSRAIVQLVDQGRLRLLEQLQEEVSPAVTFQQLPGVGPTLGERIHETLGIETLEELEQAAHDGRLEEEVEGLGPRKAAGIRDALAGRLGQSARRRARRREADQKKGPPPSVALLLQLDEEYRHRAANDELRRITPRRFNPNNEKWLPIMEVERQGWAFTLLFSNTERAHDLGKTHDWVIIYYQSENHSGQATVVTGRYGALEDKRIVRGREAECREYYRSDERPSI
jgi:ribosomal protein S13